jgi:glucokinase
MDKIILAVDLGATNIKIGLLNKNLKILAKKVLPTKRNINQNRLIETLINDLGILIRENHLAKNNILGIGVGVPGPVDFRRGIVHYLTNLPGWKEVALRDIIHSKTGIRTFIDNDVNLMTLAESKLGIAKRKKNIVCLTLGSGVGGGVMVEGSIYRGASFSAGEIGHIPINVNGPKCNCGGSACLERYIGNKYILSRARKIFKKNISLEKLSRLAKQGNKQAIKIWQEVGKYLGVALTGIVNFFNPEMIVIGGGVAEAGGVLFDSVRKIIKKRAMPGPRETVEIKKAKLGQDAGLIGAAMLVAE